jgi:hypothetical protein
MRAYLIRDGGIISFGGDFVYEESLRGFPLPAPKLVRCGGVLWLQWWAEGWPLFGEDLSGWDGQWLEPFLWPIRWPEMPCPSKLQHAVVQFVGQSYRLDYERNGSCIDHVVAIRFEETEPAKVYKLQINVEGLVPMLYVVPELIDRLRE